MLAPLCCFEIFMVCWATGCEFDDYMIKKFLKITIDEKGTCPYVTIIFL